MKVQPTAPSYAGEVTVTLGGRMRSFRFGMNTMRDYTALTGSAAGNFGKDLARDYNEALLSLVFVAMKRYVPAAELPEGFGIEHVADWLDEISEADAGNLADTVIRSIKNQNPFTAALLTRAAPPTTEAPATDGTK